MSEQEAEEPRPGEPQGPNAHDEPERPGPNDPPAGEPTGPIGDADQPPGADPRPDPHESAYVLLQRGTELVRKRHFAQAAIVLERADRAEPGKGSILEALGRAYYNSGQVDRSRETFGALLEIDPSAHYAHYALGQSLKRLGRSREARTHLRLAVALSPGSPLYRGALQRLGEPEEASSGADPPEAGSPEADPPGADPPVADPPDSEPPDGSSASST